MEYSVRIANPGDAAPLAELLRQFGWFAMFKELPIEEADRRVQAHLDRCLADESHTMLVAEAREGVVLGYVSVHWLPYLLLPDPEGYVSELFVRESARGMGVGTRMLEAVVAQARQHGCYRLMLLNFRHRESYQRGFYAKLGWEERPEAANFIYLIS
jgi:GNAT superfamily N-acetyltransferase